VKAFTLLAVCLAAVVPAIAQPPGRGGGVSFGHIHLNTANPEAAQAFWTDVIGLAAYSKGPLKGVSTIGIAIAFSKSDPSGPGVGSAIDYIAFHVPDIQPFIERLAKTGYKSSQPSGGGQLTIDGPDGVRVELNEESSMYAPLEFEYIHISSAKPAETQAWYSKVFNARPGSEDKANTSRVGGTALVFGQAESIAAPTAGRAIDHISFEVRGLEAFCGKLAGEGVKFDSPYKTQPELGMASAIITDPWGIRIELTESLGH
jgi:catechol 2,3-dioxygenase-like lactoylglutathione lyase family enzyme